MTNGNEQAFASVGEGFDNPLYSASGLSKREYFAGLMAQGLIMNADVDAPSMREAVHFADALIDALNAKD